MKEGCKNGEEEGGAGGRKEKRDWLRHPDLLWRIGSCNYGDWQVTWAPKNWCFWTAVLEKTLEKPLDRKEIKPVHPKGNQSWIFIGRTDAEAETPILWPTDAKNWLLWKDPDAGKDWRQGEKGMIEDEMVGWHHNSVDVSLSRLWKGVGQEGLSCCSPWGHKESDVTEWLSSNNIELPQAFLSFFCHLAPVLLMYLFGRWRASICLDGFCKE